MNQTTHYETIHSFNIVYDIYVSLPKRVENRS